MVFSPITFGRESIDELKKVTWPTKDDVIRLTLTVIIISIFAGLFLGIIDFGLERLIEKIVTG